MKTPKKYICINVYFCKRQKRDRRWTSVFNPNDGIINLSEWKCLLIELVFSLLFIWTENFSQVLNILLVVQSGTVRSTVVSVRHHLRLKTKKKKKEIFFSSHASRPGHHGPVNSQFPSAGSHVFATCALPPPNPPTRYRSHLNDRYKWSLCVSHGKNFSKVKSVKPKSSLSSRASPAGVTNAELQQIHLESWNHFYGGGFFSSFFDTDTCNNKNLLIL